MEWIRTAEILPPLGDCYLINIFNSGIRVAYRTETPNLWWVNDHESYSLEWVTHWMRLPEPPK
jgi:hypothetical protein